jgi:aryl-alcohol dehydrogenase-like predicted oxidoreductase
MIRRSLAAVAVASMLALAAAARHGVAAHRVALAWATRRPGTYAILGARTPTEAADLNPLPDLTAADLADLEP